MPDAALESPVATSEPRRPRSLLGQILRPTVGALLWVTLALAAGALRAPRGAIAATLVGGMFVFVYGLGGPRKDLRALAQVRLRPLTKRRAWMAGALSAFLLYELGFLFLMARLPDTDPPGKPTIFETTSSISICLVVPFIEEVWFRGWMLRSLEWRLGRIKAVLLTALVFATIHFQLSGMPHRFVSGIVMAGVLYETRSLWAAILVHVGANTLIFALLKFADQSLILSSTGLLLGIAALTVGLSGLAIAYATRGRPSPAALAVVQA
jgi:membrane protease YdiL (CAAX protease family)